MNKRTFFLVILFWVVMIPFIKGQGVIVFGYDADGNQLKKGITDRRSLLNTLTDSVYKDTLVKPYLTGNVNSAVIKTYPNPAVNHFLIKLNQVSQNTLVNYRLYDYTGELFLKSSFVGTYSGLIDVSFLGIGVYFLIVEYEDKIEKSMILKTSGY